MQRSHNHGPTRHVNARALSLALLSLAWGAPALAQQGPVSADPEMVNPRFGANTVIGVPAADADVRNTVRWGLVLQYERNPVTGYRLDEEVGTIVSNRIAAHAGVSWDFTDWGTARVVVPLNVNFGTEIPDFEAGGAGLGDISVGLQFLPLRTPYFNLGLYGDLIVPSGRSSAYMGEPSIRGVGGLQLMAKIPTGSLVSLDLMGNGAVQGRQVLITRQDFDNGPELILSESARLRFAWTKVDIAFVQALVARSQFTNFFGGGAENGLEVYGGVQVPIRDIGFNTDMQIDVMAGRGTTQGYGTTDFRLLGGITFTRNPGRKPRPVPIVVKPPPPPIIPPPIEEEEPPPVDAPYVKDDQIVIPYPIEFFVDTANIKPESLPLLEKVAGLINEQAKIKHVVVEGHASEEGDFQYNYDLSKERSEAIFKQLILDGVSPDRVSYRSFGEVRPKPGHEGGTEEDWAVNRRVEFHIVAQFGADTVDWPDYGTSTVLPWSGETWKIVTPKNPDELEEEELRKLYEKEQRDNFIGAPVEEFELDGTASPKAPADKPAAPPAEEAPATNFVAPPAEDFEFEGEAAPAEAPPPAPEPEPAAEPAAPTTASEPADAPPASEESE